MIIHKEGKGTLGLVFIVLFAVNALIQWAAGNQLIEVLTLATSVILYVIVLQFFRNPKRVVQVNPNGIICPADGKVVTIEEVYEPFLVQQGYMVRTSRGRMVTDMAYEHLNKPRTDSAQQEIF